MRRMGTHFSVVKIMAEQIVLRGDFDLAKTHAFLNDCDEVESIVDTQIGGFTVRFRDLRGVSFQFYSAGTALVNTDDYSDPADHIYLAEQAAVGREGEFIKFSVKSYRHNPTDSEWFTRALLLREMGVLSPEALNTLNREVRWFIARLKRICQAAAHRRIGKVAPGGDEYRTTLEELGILSGMKPLNERHGASVRSSG